MMHGLVPPAWQDVCGAMNLLSTGLLLARLAIGIVSASDDRKSSWKAHLVRRGFPPSGL
jgi:hypothetical protein